VGNEADCRARYGAQSGEGHALLETKELLFRGPFRLALPFAELRKVEARNGTLHLEHGGKKAAFELGPLAEKWAEKIKNPRSRIAKLGIKPGQRVAILGVPDAALKSEVEAQGAQVVKTVTDCDAIFFGVSSKRELARLRQLKAGLKKAGALWLIRPKGPASPVGERDTMDAGKAAGLVDVKVVGFSETHSAEKFVIPLAKR
jgi:hypothetical protein